MKWTLIIALGIICFLLFRYFLARPKRKPFQVPESNPELQPPPEISITAPPAPFLDESIHVHDGVPSIPGNAEWQAIKATEQHPLTSLLLQQFVEQMGHPFGPTDLIPTSVAYGVSQLRDDDQSFIEWIELFVAQSDQALGRIQPPIGGPIIAKEARARNPIRIAKGSTVGTVLVPGIRRVSTGEVLLHATVLAIDGPE